MLELPHLLRRFPSPNPLTPSLFTFPLGPRSYGHAVLRKTDPRYMAQREFAQKHMPKDVSEGGGGRAQH